MAVCDWKRALWLLDAQIAQKLFVSGVHRGVDVAELMRVSLQSPARADCCIVWGYEADNTAGNAYETAEWVAREGYSSIRLVTAAYHMPRSLLSLVVSCRQSTSSHTQSFPTMSKRPNGTGTRGRHC